MTEQRTRARIDSATKDRSALDGMRRSFRTILDRQRENAHRIPDIDSRKDRLRKIKESSVGNDELFCQALATLHDNGFRVIVAKTAEDAIRAVSRELEGQDFVVKSKSNVTKELHLAERLAEGGIDVVETDLGDRIIQLAGCEAAHPTGPACHLTRGQIAGLFSEHFGKRVSDGPKELTSLMRDEIAGFLSKARVGITGTNAITACEGAVVVVHNEGNAAMCAMRPDKHIVVTTPDKVVPSLEDAMNVVKLQTYLSTGKIVSSYINVITGPSYTADIEKQLHRGMHGPKEVVIVFVDDGRLSADDKEAQYCIGCGMCLLHCPVYNVLGPEFGPAGHKGGQGVYLAGSRGKLDESLDAGLYLCTSCGSCAEVCPASIDTKKGLSSIKNEFRMLKKDISPERAAIVASVRNYDNPWQAPKRAKAKWSEGLGLRPKGELVFFAGCSTSLVMPENAARTVGLLRACGTDPAYLGPSEKCCGSTVRKLGEENLARQKAEECLSDFQRAGARTVVTSCPGCASALNHYTDLVEKYGVKIQHISQFLDEHLPPSALAPFDGLGRVVYHDPCDLGRALGVYDPPRRLLETATGARVTEMERTRELSACCGSGSGVKSAYPSLAAEIGRDRLALAKAAGADTLVTACPWCVQNLRDCQEGSSAVRVMDLVEVLHSALKPVHSETEGRRSTRR
ncbi:MAG: LUD domain-containing protein [Candidatus Thermoplasmatota archaeon]|nr:LUD domain-containing protein [Candidatus Thermoplasmatota archaeon]